jgi:hypothetical protein
MEQQTLHELEPGSLIEPTPEMQKQFASRYNGDPVIYLGALPHYTTDDTSVVYVAPVKTPLASRWFNCSSKALLNRVSGIEEVVADLKRQKIYPAPMNALAMTIGSDPEIFVSGYRGKLMPAWTFLPAKSRTNKIYWDGFQAEFATNPRTCLVEYVGSVAARMNDLLHYAKERSKYAKLMPNSVIDVDLDTLAKTEEKYVQFGCKPSIHIYGDQGDAIDARLLTKRFAGGHIHGGARLIHKPLIEHVTRALDGLLGLPAVGMAASLDQPIRRRFYGRAGEIRLPEHGLEYRVLSNFWLLHPALTHLVHEMFRVAFRFGVTGYYQSFFNTPQAEVQRIINECDVEAARKAVAANEPLFLHLYKSMNVYGSDPKHMLDAIYKGIEYVLPNMNINENWDAEKITDLMHKHYRGSGTGRWSGGGFTWQRLSNMLSSGSVHPVMV